MGKNNMRRNQEPAPKPDPVRLKDLAGLRPEKYIIPAYLIGFLLILFVVGFLPAMISRGAYVTVTSYPSGAAVWNGDRFLGSTPFTQKLDAGTYNLRFNYPGASPVQQTMDVGGSIFLSLIWPGTEEHHFDNSPLEMNHNELFASYGPQLAEQSAMIGESPRTNYHFEPLYENIAQSLASNGLSNYLDPLVELGSLANNRAMVRDLSRGFWALAGADGLGTPLSIAAMAKELHEADLQQLLSLANDLLLGPVVEQGSYPWVAQGSGDRASVDLLGTPIALLQLADGNFITESEVSRVLFQRFTDQETQWSRSNRDALVEKGLVQESYLYQGYEDDVAPTGQVLGVSAVSWYSAVAFAQWVDQQLPNYRISLPNPDDYRSFPQWSHTSLWQWTNAPYLLDPRYDGEQLELNSDFAEIVGGSWRDGDRPEGLPRASFPKHWTSPMVGFRLRLEPLR